jgi:exosortase B
MNNNSVASIPKRPALVLLLWVLVFFSFCLLYIPTFIDLFKTLWKTDQNAHGPIILAISLWFLVFRAKQISKDPGIKFVPASFAGWITVTVGLFIYIIGRSQAIYLFEVGSIIPVLAGSILIVFGRKVLRHLWFVLFFMLFMIPLPGSVVDMATLPMKIAVSWGAEHLLYAMDYPVGREGVTLSVGQYKLLVADACAGLNSLFSLEALGLLYLNVMRHESVLRNTALAILIVPISFTSNLVRIVLLCLITYHFGDEVGQGFLHEFSGIALFVIALLLIIGLDSMLRKLSIIAIKYRGFHGHR